jgi:hypothetical protein
MRIQPEEPAATRGNQEDETQVIRDDEATLTREGGAQLTREDEGRLLEGCHIRAEVPAPR